MEIENWFKGFEKGLERLSPEQRSAFLSECGRNCVNGGTLSVYQKLHERAQGDMDIFFQMANELPGVRGEVVEKGRVYRLAFLECTCELCKKGFVTTPLLCECSRQSVIYSLQCLWKEKHFTVTLCHSILRGGTDCEMRIIPMMQRQFWVGARISMPSGFGVPTGIRIFLPNLRRWWSNTMVITCILSQLLLTISSLGISF